MLKFVYDIGFNGDYGVKTVIGNWMRERECGELLLGPVLKINISSSSQVTASWLYVMEYAFTCYAEINGQNLAGNSEPILCWCVKIYVIGP